MLARVAEHLYWLGRYVERAEDTARLFDATVNLMLDLPTGSPLNWAASVETLSPEAQEQMPGEASETRVSRWLLLDVRNPSSVRSSIKAARENARIARDLIPRDAWLVLNRLDITLTELASGALSRRKRSEILREVIGSCRHFSGVLHGSMSRDEAWQFLRLGLQLERADMGSRLLDFRSTSLFPDEEWQDETYMSLGWMGVLQAQDGYEMYRQSVNNQVRPDEALGFLMHSVSFPRSLVYALSEVEGGLLGLPIEPQLARDARQIRQWVLQLPAQGVSPSDLSTHMDNFQARLEHLHAAIHASFFFRKP